jgi:very-short-patch-repair endonuclease
MSAASIILAVMRGGTVPGMRRLPGIFATGELLDSGLSERQIARQVACGALVRFGLGFYATADLADRLRAFPFGAHFLQAFAVVGLLGPETVASHRTAAHLHGIDLLVEPGATVTVTRPPGSGSRRGRSGVHLYIARMPDAHQCDIFGLPVSSAARTVIDLARSAPFREGVVVADSALHQKLTTKDELRTVLADCRAMRGCVTATAVVEFADALAESPLESIARVVFRDCKLPVPSLQVTITNAMSDFIGRVDFLWPKHRTIAEVDGLMKYTDPVRARDQLRRDQRLRDAGYEVVHFDWRDITTNPSGVGAAIRAAFRAARQRGLVA